METTSPEVEVAFVNGNNFGFDEYFCFNIMDFKVGDAIEYQLGGGGSKSPRVRGVVSRVSKKDLRIYFRAVDGSQSSVRINDVVFLSENIRGWLGGARIS